YSRFERKRCNHRHSRPPRRRIAMAFNANLLIDLQQMLQYQFMQHAFEAGTLVALVAGIVGYFVVLRRSAFAAHALSHIGFAGAAGAVLFGLSPVLGLLLFTSVGGIGMTVRSEERR